MGLYSPKHFLQQIARCSSYLEIHRLVFSIHAQVSFYGALYQYLTNNVADADNIDAFGRHLDGMGGGEASLLYHRPVYGINRI